MDILTVVGLGIVTATVCILLRQYRPEYAMLAAIACGMLLFWMVIASLSPALETISDLMSRASIPSGYTEAILKTLGICYITQLASDACRDAGQTVIASKVELAGKVLIVLISLPLFENLVGIAFSLMGVS